MLRELMEAWRGRDLLSRMLTEFDEMLRDAEWMYRMVWQVVFRELPPKEVEAEIYARDKKVNRMQRRVRRQVIEHLTLRPEANLAACLVLMSVVKDAERIGDYCKGIYEVGEGARAPFEGDSYAEPLHHTVSDVEALFDQVRVAFREGREQLADDLLHRCREIAKRCDRIIRGLFRSELPAPKAVGYTLLFRYLKRIDVHMLNIATAVVAPVHEIDYITEYLRDEGEPETSSA
jgi:phosphate uptake regulator